MSAVTRIKRPTYATPRKLSRERFVHVSTNYAWLPVNPLRPMDGARFAKVGPGSTYRRPA